MSGRADYGCKEEVVVSEQIYILVARMVEAGMAKQYKAVWELYEEYLRERHLYISINEMLEAKRRKMAG